MICEGRRTTTRTRTGEEEGLKRSGGYLHTESSAGVPEGDGLVSRAGADVIAEGLPDDTVHTVHVASEGLAAAVRVQVPETSGVVHGAGGHEVAAVVHAHVPDGLSVVREGGRTARLREVPELDRFIP